MKKEISDRFAAINLTILSIYVIRALLTELKQGKHDTVNLFPFFQQNTVSEDEKEAT